MVGILIVSHRRIAVEMVDSARDILGKGLVVEMVEVMPDSDVDEIDSRIREMVSDMLENSKEVLVFTDMIGSTPTNLAFNSAMEFIDDGNNIKVITGFNLPMLITALTYQRDISLEKLAQKTLETGRMTLIDLTRRYDLEE